MARRFIRGAAWVCGRGETPGVGAWDPRPRICACVPPPLCLLQSDPLHISAASIARRLRDPLSELVKIEPVVDCSNHVTASVLLKQHATHTLRMRRFREGPLTNARHSFAHSHPTTIAPFDEHRPRAIGVGMYQHDVSEKQLAERLDAVVQQCVSEVGLPAPARLPRLESNAPVLVCCEPLAVHPQPAPCLPSPRPHGPPLPSR